MYHASENGDVRVLEKVRAIYRNENLISTRSLDTEYIGREIMLTVGRGRGLRLGASDRHSGHSREPRSRIILDRVTPNTLDVDRVDNSDCLGVLVLRMVFLCVYLLVLLQILGPLERLFAYLHWR